jgi:hypothetical protein
MVEERRASALTESELDAALAEAFAAEPSLDFAARVRARIADEKVPTTGPFAYLAAAAALGAAVIVFVMLVIERKPVDESRLPVAAATSSRRPVASRVAPILREPLQATSPAARPPRRNRGRGEFQELQSPSVLIPVAEQRALRRLLERPPTAVLRFAPSVEPTAVAAIAIPPLTIDPLSPQVEEGGHQ